MSDAHDHPTDVSRAQYEAWVRSYAKELFTYSYRLTGHREMAEELVQETFVQAWKHRSSLRDQGAVRSWLFTICRNAANRALRNRAVRRTINGPIGNRGGNGRPDSGIAAGGTEMTLDDLPAQDPHHETQVADRDALQRGLNSLDESIRVPFVMVFVEGKSCRDTATEMGIPFGTVLSRLNRARQHLRRALARSYEFTHQEVRKDRAIHNNGSSFAGEGMTSGTRDEHQP